MNHKEFIQGFETVLVPISGKPKVIGYMKGGRFRKVVQFSKHVLHKREGKPPAIAIEKWVYESIIKPKCALIEVFDEERNLILRTTTHNFETHCEEWHWNNLHQFILEEPYWQIERVGEPQPSQARLI